MSLYHFVALNQNSFQKVILSKGQIVDLHYSQCLHGFQIEALEFLDKCLAKGKFCIYNDESGLGKTAVVSVLLGTAGRDKKTLVIVQNEDEYVTNWHFHISILSALPVCVINGVTDSTESPHNIYIAKWTTIRSIGDLSKFNFDWVIVDNKGDTLNNTFCYSMLVKNFERKVNILISSVDVTSDVKLLHNILRLGGRLDPQFENYKIFLEKFKLPDSKEIAKNKIDLEEYYSKRAMLCDLVKDFRVRRYRHQYDAFLPLVQNEEYNNNLKQWLEVEKAKQQANAVVISDSSTSTNSGSSQGGRVIKQEIISLPKINDPTPSELQFETPDLTEEPEAMSPLLLLSDSEESEDNFNVQHIPQDFANDNDENNGDIEESEQSSLPNIETPQERIEQLFDDKKQKPKQKKQEKPTRRSEPILLRDKSSPRARRKASKPLRYRTLSTERELSSSRNSAGKRKLPASSKKERKNEQKGSPAKKARTSSSSERKGIDKTKEIVDLTDSQSGNIKIKIEDTSPIKETKKPEGKSSKQSPKDSCKPQEVSKKSPKTKTIKKEPIRETTFRETRCMSRITRSAPSNKNKYFNTCLMIPYEPEKKKRRSAPIKSASNCKKEEEKSLPGSSSAGRKLGKTLKDNKENTEQNPKTRKSLAKDSPKSKQAVKKSPVAQNKNSQKKSPQKSSNKNPAQKSQDKSKSKEGQLQSQNSVISSSSSAYDNIQCGQRLELNSELNNLVNLKASGKFQIPSSKATQSASMFNEPDLIIISPPSEMNNRKTTEIVVLSSSHEDSSVSSIPCEFSRRTLALKPKKIVNKRMTSVSSGRAFTQIHAFPRRAQSPDLFSTCSEALTCTQSNVKDSTQTNKEDDSETNRPFGFKIFGSEVKQLQQQYAERESANPNTSRAMRKNTRSCLNILENMFEPSSSRGSTSAIITGTITSSTIKVNKNNSSGGKATSSSKSKKNQTPIVPSHPITAIEMNKQKKAAEKAAKEAKAQDLNDSKQKKKSPSKKNNEGGTIKKKNSNAGKGKGKGGEDIIKIKRVNIESIQTNDPKRTNSVKASLLECSDDVIFEITNNSTFGPRLRLDSNGDVVPLQNQTQPQNGKATQNNKITKYFMGTQTQSAAASKLCTPPPLNNDDDLPHTPNKRPNSASSKKSPKNSKTPTQATKLTRWLTKNANNQEEGLSQNRSNNHSNSNSPSKKSPFKKALELNLALQQVATSSTNKASKSLKATQRRRRLDMSKE